MSLSFLESNEHGCIETLNVLYVTLNVNILFQQHPDS